MEAYGKHRPTPFDHHIALEDREDWLLAPVSQTRDSATLDRCNFSSFKAALAEVDPTGEDHETHRFGHWGPGWYEIIIIRPGSKAADEAERLEARLENYPVLDEDALFEAEHEDAAESWENYGRSDWRRLLSAEFERADDWPDEAIDVLWHDASDRCEWSEEHDNEGCRFNFRDAITKVGRDECAKALHETRRATRAKAVA